MSTVIINMYQVKNNLRRVKFAKNIYHQVIKSYKEAKNLSWQKSQLQYFILIANGRSGSTCLLDLFDYHPQIATNPHIFYNYSNLPENFGVQKYTYSRKNVLGFKFKAQPESLAKNVTNARIARQELEKLSNLGVKIIYLRRKNLLKRAFSKLVARNKLRKSNYNLNFRKQERKSITINSLEVNLDELWQDLKECELQEQFNQQVISELPCLNLIYEEDLLHEKNHQEALNKVCQFLNINPTPAITRYAKVVPDNISDYVSNYDALVRKLQNTSYEQYLH